MLNVKGIGIFLKHFLICLKAVEQKGFSLPSSTKDQDDQCQTHIISQVG